MDKASAPSSTFGHEEHDNRGVFFYEQDGERLGRMMYTRSGESRINIDHTEVSPSVGGRGIGRKLLDTAVAWARATNTKVTATCPFASAQFKRDPSIRDVLA